jgi:hypothetical protein
LVEFTLDTRHSLFDSAGFHAAKVPFIRPLAKIRFRVNRTSHFTKANGTFHFAKVVKVEAANDLALLKAEGFLTP